MKAEKEIAPIENKTLQGTADTNAFTITGTDAEDIRANNRATMTLKIALSEGVLLLDQNKKNQIALENKQDEILADLYKKANELQKLLEAAAVKLGVDLKQPGWQFDQNTLKLFR